MHVNLTTLFQRIAKFTEKHICYACQSYKSSKESCVEKPNHARYLELFKAIDSFDGRLQNRYDGITGGHYIETISYLYAEGILKEDDLEICEEEMKNEVTKVKTVLEM